MLRFSMSFMMAFLALIAVTIPFVISQNILAKTTLRSIVKNQTLYHSSATNYENAGHLATDYIFHELSDATTYQNDQYLFGKNPEFTDIPLNINVKVSSERIPLNNLKFAAGKVVDADISIENGSFDGDILCIAVLNQEDNLVSVVREDVKVQSGAKTTGRVSIDVPKNAKGMTYQLFVWDDNTYEQLTDSMTLEYREAD